MANLVTQYPAIPAPTQDVAALQATCNALKEAVEILCGTRNKNTQGLGQAIFELKSATSTKDAQLTAHILQVDEVSTSNLEAVASRTLTLESSFSTLSTTTDAKFTDVIQTIANGDGALAQRSTTLEAQMAGTSASGLKTSLSASIAQVDQARVDGDGAIAARTLTLESNYTAAAAGFPSLSARITDVTQTSANATAAVASRATHLEAKFDMNEDSALLHQTSTWISDEQTARATADGALSQQIVDLGTTVNGHTATLTETKNSVDGMSVLYSVMGNIDGVTGGFKMSGVKKNDGSVQYGVEIDGDLTVDGTIHNAKLGAFAATQGGYTSGTGAWAYLTSTSRGTGVWVVLANYAGTGPANFAPNNGGYFLDIFVDAIMVSRIAITGQVATDSSQMMLFPASSMWGGHIDAGEHSFTAKLTGAVGNPDATVGTMQILAIELSK